MSGRSIGRVTPAALFLAACVVAPGFAFPAPRPPAGETAPLSGETVPLNTFDVPPGATVTVTFQVTVDGPPLPPGVTAVANQGTLTGSNFSPVPTDDPDDPNSNADPTVTVIDSADLSITKTDGQGSAIPGDPIAYTITVSNAGPNDAVGATVADTFPAALTGVSWTCVASAGSSCTAGPVGGDINDVVTVLSGGTLTYTVNATIDPAATGSLANTATVTPPTNTQDPNLGDNSATDTDVLTPQADLAILKDNGVTSVTAGQPTTYTITVTNAGPSDAPGSLVTDTFPAALTGVSWTCVASAGSSCTAGPVAGNITDAVIVLAGGTLTYSATGTVDAGATGTLSNTATIAPGVADPNGANNSSTDADPIVASADLSITKVDDADPPAPGANLTYTITVDNAGPSDATGVTVTDNLPAGVTLVATAGCAEDPNGAPTCTLGSIPSGGMASYTIEVSIDPAPPAMLSNTATVTANEPDPNAGNNSDTEETTLDAVPPEVDLVDSVAGTGDGELTQCETARVALTALVVTFSEELTDTGAGDPASVTDPANYRLVMPAPGADFDTVSCAGGTGGDTVVAIDGVTYDSNTSVATVEINGGAPLADGLSRLFVCGTIEDLAGNPLDGGGGPGSDFIRGFRVDRYNLFADAHFDTYDPACDLSAWTSTSPTAVEIAAPDAAGAPPSGSAHNTDPFVGFDLGQCIPLAGGQEHDVAAAVRVDAAIGELGFFELGCEFFDAPACGGASAGSAALAAAVGDTGGGFLAFADVFTPPAGAASGLCRADAEAPSGAAFDLYLDDLFIGNDVIFADGFESGDTSAWTLAVP